MPRISPFTTLLRRILAVLLPGRRPTGTAASASSRKAALRPRELVHPDLGKLVLNPGAGHYALEIGWVGPGQHITLMIPADEADAIARTAGTVQALLADKHAVNDGLQRYMAEQLLPSTNAELVAGGRPPLTPNELWRLVRLTSVTVYANGSYAFFYEDGDVLGGHFIEISGDLLQGPSFLDTPG